ncbi:MULTISPECIES: hypothetical protein [Micrococcaceae]|uniref:Uncharacterized protein n=1 Tax=Glutamicibacter soli TaxID=453836 RepID=A0A365YK09_9MICC|nr:MULTISPECIES: hypothetical protein [Micrococcaceae]ALQ31770.1 hypothetical protein ATC04_15235 [Arthrobacter sp. YC-RL1]RBM03041.1 hypothetical protein C1H84_06410 [Glutamicibacter soli]
MAKKVRKSKEYRKPSQFVEQQGEALDRKLNKYNVQSTSHENKSNPMLLISAGLAISLFLFIYLHGMALSQMTDLSNNLSMPDQRVFGYTVEDIEALRSAMDEDARGQLNYVHKTAGMLFPLFTAAMSMLLFIRWIPNRRTRLLAWCAPLGFAVADIVENFAIDALFTANEVTAGAVMFASILTTIRWALLIITAGLIIGLGLSRANRSLKRKMAEVRDQSS